MCTGDLFYTWITIKICVQFDSKKNHQNIYLVKVILLQARCGPEGWLEV